MSQLNLLDKIMVAREVILARPVENKTESGIVSVAVEDRKEPMRAEIIKIGEGSMPVEMLPGMIVICKAFMDYKVDIGGNALVFIEFHDILASYSMI